MSVRDPSSSSAGPSTPSPSSSLPFASSSSSSSSASASSSSSTTTTTSTNPSSSSPPYYSFGHHPPHTSPTALPVRPLEPTILGPTSPSLREPPAADLIPANRPTLAQFRANEGAAERTAKLKALWEDLPALPTLEGGDAPTALQRMKLPGQDTMTALSPERADRLRRLYEEELVRRVKEKRPEARLWGGADHQPEVVNTVGKGIEFEDFRRFLWDQEHQLWDIFQDLDKNGDGRLDASEMREALARGGIDITPATVDDLVRFLASGSKPKVRSKQITDGSASARGVKTVTPKTPIAASTPEDMYITFAEFRDFLIMLPRKATPFEIYKFYQVRKRFSDGSRGAARVDKEGDINISFPKRNPTHPSGTEGGDEEGGFPKSEDFGDTVDETPIHEDRHEAWRFLLAGAVAGGVSRTVTAPFDRLKIYLITTGDPSYTNIKATKGFHPIHVPLKAMSNLWGAITRIYVDGGGLRAFWVGNGLNIVKILPESAIKFVSYEQSKIFLAKYWDKVSDPSELAPSSRFIAGGIGGITSQFAIYGLETLKTRIQSEVGPALGVKGVVRTMKGMWRQGGIRSYYRGLTLGLVGVFPYSAIDMGTYETLKTTYCRSTGAEEPPVFAVLSFGALSGSIGAASVYPINLLRTRLQASGSSGHPKQYTGFVDVAQQTLRNEGWRGLYKGLLPSILKVGPAVGVSWIVYEDAKKRLGV